MAHQAADGVAQARVKLGRVRAELVVAGAVHEGEVEVAALARVIHGPLGHERRHGAAFGEEGLGEGLEEGCPVGALRTVGGGEGRFPHARAGFTVQALQRRANVFAIVHQRLEPLGVRAGAQHRIAEVARRQRPQVAIRLFADGVGRLVEHEQLVFEAGGEHEAQAIRDGQRPPQRGTGADGVVRGAIGRLELADEVGHTLVWQPALGVHQQAVLGVREAGVPAGEVAAVVELVVDVPAEHAVAEAATLAQDAGELLQAHVLAANHAVDVRQAELHLAGAALPIAGDLRFHFLHGLIAPTCGTVPAHCG